MRSTDHDEIGGLLPLSVVGSEVGHCSESPENSHIPLLTSHTSTYILFYSTDTKTKYPDGLYVGMPDRVMSLLCRRTREVSHVHWREY